MSILHVYCMPGMAANPTIFEKIKLPEESFRIHWLDWMLPENKETLREYAMRMCNRINHANSVLIGVSLGGILVQEMAKIIPVKRVIIISSVKSSQELPKRYRVAKYTGLYKVIPTSFAGRMDLFQKLAVGQFAKGRAKLYKRYLSVTDARYLDWAIEQLILWDQKEPIPGVVHIHGDQDYVFPYKNIKSCITVHGGTHVMIVMRYKWFNENLEEIIATGKLKN